MNLFSCWTLQEHSIIASSCTAAGTIRTGHINVTLERRYKCWNGTTNRFHNRNFPTKLGAIRCNIRFYIGTTRVGPAFWSFLHQIFWWWWTVFNLTNQISFSLQFVTSYYPKGGGHCIVNARPVKCLNAINLVDCGDVARIFGWSFVAGTLPIHVSYFVQRFQSIAIQWIH